MRLAFLGSDGIALPLLEWLWAQPKVELVVVYTQPDRPVGRGQKVQANAIKLWALAHAVPVLQPERLGESERKELASRGVDLGLVMAYGHLLKESFLATPRLGMVNFHASLLPSLRGASPIQTALASGLKQTGVSLMRMVRALDAGPVAAMESVPIDRRDTALDLETRLSQACVPLLARCFSALCEGALDFVAQDETRATFCRRLVKEDGVLDFRAPAEVLAARINGLYPWPACHFFLDTVPVKIGLADTTPVSGATAGPGLVLGRDAEGLLVATGAGTLRLLRLQKPGGKMLAATEFLRGFPIPAGTCLPSLPMPELLRPAQGAAG